MVRTVVCCMPLGVKLSGKCLLCADCGAHLSECQCSTEHSGNQTHMMGIEVSTDESTLGAFMMEFDFEEGKHGNM